MCFGRMLKICFELASLGGENEDYESVPTIPSGPGETSAQQRNWLSGHCGRVRKTGRRSSSVLTRVSPLYNCRVEKGLLLSEGHRTASRH